VKQLQISFGKLTQGSFVTWDDKAILEGETFVPWVVKCSSTPKAEAANKMQILPVGWDDKSYSEDGKPHSSQKKA